MNPNVFNENPCLLSRFFILWSRGRYIVTNFQQIAYFLPLSSDEEWLQLIFPYWINKIKGTVQRDGSSRIGSLKRPLLKREARKILEQSACCCESLLMSRFRAFSYTYWQIGNQFPTREWNHHAVGISFGSAVSKAELSFSILFEKQPVYLHWFQHWFQSSSRSCRYRGVFISLLPTSWSGRFSVANIVERSFLCCQHHGAFISLLPPSWSVHFSVANIVERSFLCCQHRGAFISLLPTSWSGRFSVANIMERSFLCRGGYFLLPNRE